MLKDKNLLVLSHTYNSFIKDPVEILSKEFKRVYVLVRYQPISELAKYIPFSFFKSRIKYSKEQSIDLTNLPSNVDVIPLPLWYLPFKRFYYPVGKQHARVALKVIKDRNIEFDLIHAHFLWSAGYAGEQIKKVYGKPLVVTGHGYDIYDLPNRDERLKKGIVTVLKNSNKVLTVSEKNKENLKSLGRSDVKVFPNGYTNSLFYFKDKEKCRESLKLPMNKKILLTVGSLETVKGYEYMIEAIKIVKEKEPNILCLHIGGGSLEKSLRGFVESYGLENNFKFLGRIPHNQLVDYFGASDMFVSSSLSEGNPTVMFESLGCGKPFIGTRVGGVPDIVNSSDYGLLCEPKDIEKLSENIIKALNTKWDTEKILSYSKQFSWENICKEILKIYMEVLK